MNTKTVKSLMYRRLILTKKNISIYFLISIVIAVLSWAVLLSSKVGNLRFMFDTPEESAEVISQAMICLNISVAVALAGVFDDTTVFVSDIKSRWREYSVATPATWKENAVSRAALFTIFSVASILVNFVNVGVVSLINGEVPEKYMFFTGFAAIDVLLFLRIIFDFFNIKAKTEKQVVTEGKQLLIGYGLAFSATMIFKDELRELGEKMSKDFIDVMTEWCNKYLIWSVPLFFVVIAAFAAMNLYCYRKETQR